MGAIQFLKQEHKKAKAGLKKVLKAPAETWGDLWSELQPDPEAHEQIEDAGLYEPLARATAKTAPKLAAWRVRHQRERHQKEVERVETLVKQIDGLDPAAVWLAKVEAVGASLEQHIREEEGEIFPRIGKAWDKARLEEAGTEMAEMKAEKLHA
jgi:hemerythrin-like domain-containing protein